MATRYKMELLREFGGCRVAPHTEVNGKTYQPGDVFWSNRNLDEVFPHKFKLLETEEVADEDAEETDTDLSEDEDGDGQPDPAEDVTDQFEGAKEGGIKILKIGKKYSLHDEDQQVGEPTSKKNMVKRVAKYLK